MKYLDFIFHSELFLLQVHDVNNLQPFDRSCISLNGYAAVHMLLFIPSFVVYKVCKPLITRVLIGIVKNKAI